MTMESIPPTIGLTFRPRMLHDAFRNMGYPATTIEADLLCGGLITSLVPWRFVPAQEGR